MGPWKLRIHNGQLSNYHDLKPDYYRPVGNTDSELAFCWLLDKIREKYPKRPSNMASVFRYAAKLAHTLREKGVFNMLLTDGVYVLAYCTNNLHWITRRAPFGKATLIDADMVIDFQKETTPNDVVTVDCNGHSPMMNAGRKWNPVSLHCLKWAKNLNKR